MSKSLLNYFESDRLECGIDEAGLGCLFGRAYVAAVIWNPEIEPHKWLNDSKKVTPRRREFLYDYIMENALDYSVYYIEPGSIDTYNILSAKLYGMHRAVDKLNIVPDHILVDGDQFNKYYSKQFKQYIPHTTIVEGDSKYTAISAASILAKVSRDRYIEKLCQEYPILSKQWSINTNKGYGTSKHLDGILEYGITDQHRRTFGVCNSATSIKNLENKKT